MKETFQRRQLWGKPNQLQQEMPFMIKGYLIRQVDWAQVLVMRMITIFMKSHCLLIEHLQAFTKMLIERQALETQLQI